MTFADHGSVPQRARRALPYAAGVVALLVTAGCTSGSPQSVPPSTAPLTTSSSAATTLSPTTTATPTPSVDPVIAKIPAAARPETIEGAEAFARFYVNQINFAFTKPDQAALSGLHSTTCDTCDVYKNTAADFQTKGQRQKTSLLRVTSATASEFSQGEATVNVFFEQSAVDIVDDKGSRVGRTSAGKGAFVFNIIREQDRWTVSELKAVSS